MLSIKLIEEKYGDKTLESINKTAVDQLFIGSGTLE